MKTCDFLTGIGLLLLATVSWGGMFPAVKAMLAYMDPFYMTSIRYGITALLFLALLAGVEGIGMLRTGGRTLELWLFGTAGFAGFSLLVFSGLRYTSAENGAIITALMPLLAALTNWAARGLRPAPFTLASIGLALAGVLLVVTHGSPAALLHGAGALGDVLVLLGVFAWTVYTFGATRFSGWSPLHYTALSCTLGTASVIAVTAALSFTGTAHLPSAAALQATLPPMAYTIVFASVLGVLAWNAGVKRLGPVNGALFINFVPVTALIIGLAQGHVFGVFELVGAGVTVLSLLANNLYLRAASSGRRLAGGAEFRKPA